MMKKLSAILLVVALFFSLATYLFAKEEFACQAYAYCTSYHHLCTATGSPVNCDDCDEIGYSCSADCYGEYSGHTEGYYTCIGTNCVCCVY